MPTPWEDGFCFSKRWGGEVPLFLLKSGIAKAVTQKNLVLKSQKKRKKLI